MYLITPTKYFDVIKPEENLDPDRIVDYAKIIDIDTILLERRKK